MRWSPCGLARRRDPPRRLGRRWFRRMSEVGANAPPSIDSSALNNKKAFAKWRADRLCVARRCTAPSRFREPRSTRGAGKAGSRLQLQLIPPRDRKSADVHRHEPLQGPARRGGGIRGAVGQPRDASPHGAGLSRVPHAERPGARRSSLYASHTIWASREAFEDGRDRRPSARPSRSGAARAALSRPPRIRGFRGDPDRGRGGPRS